jgi:hypothetical protein
MMSISCGGRASCVSARCSSKLRNPASRTVRALRLSTSRTNNRKNSRSTFVVRAADGAPESYTMDYQGALKFLGLNEGASSEDMVRAKNQMISRYQEEEEKLKKVEAAYDVVLMRSLMKRSQGEVSDNKVKYADVLSPGAAVKQKLPPWARDMTNNMTNKLPPRPAFEAPEGETITQGGIAFAVLSALILFQGCSQAPGVDDPPGLQLSIAMLGAVWLLRERKNLKLSRSIFLATLGLASGAAIGGLVAGWLRVDIVPLGALSSPSAVVSEFGLAGIIAAAAFLY